MLYLHGFALCMPSFYENHLLALAAEGSIVFFPDFQRSDYPDPAPLAPVPTREDLPLGRLWSGMALRMAGGAPTRPFGRRICTRCWLQGTEETRHRPGPRCPPRWAICAGWCSPCC